MRIAWLLFLYAFFIPSSQGSSNDATGCLAIGCSSHCSVGEKKHTSCFNKTQAYFERVLYGLMKSYVLTQMHIYALPGTNLIFDKDAIENETISRYQKIYAEDIKDEQGILDDVDSIRQIAVQMTEYAEKSVKQNLTNIPLPLCPIGCKKSYALWQILFFSSCVVTVILVAVLIILTTREQIKMERDAKRIYLEDQAKLKLTVPQPVTSVTKTTAL